VWIAFSDRILLAIIDNVELMTTVQTAKGWLFITVTTLLIFYLLKKEISEVKKIEEALILSEKMLSISHLASGMANQINNPLAGIVQNAQILRNRLTEVGQSNIRAAEETGVDLEKVIEYAEKREIARILNSIVESGKNASDLIERMMDFSHEGSRQKVMVNPSGLLNSTIDLLKQEIRFGKVEVFREIAEVPPIPCDVQKLKHAFYHILSNAMEASVGQGIEPGVWVEMTAQGKGVEISVTDKGAGMTEKDLSRIYDPFYTTKSGAMGIGLPIANFIITEIHKGKLTVYSHPGRGCRVVIFMPQ